MKSEGRKYEKALVFIVLIAVLGFVSVGCASAATIYVPDDYAKIQWAVDNATEGATIIVRDGTYTENVNVNKQLTIRSENGSASTIVQAADSYDHVFEVTANYVNISGFTVKGATGGHYYPAGIYLYCVDYCNISNNNYSNNDYGIRIFDSSNNKLTDNIMVNNGIAILGDELSHFTHEIDTSNKVNGKPVYYWKDVGGGRIADDTGQVILVNCSNVIVENQNLNNASVGIGVFFSSHITIKNNNCSNNHDGIRFRYSNNNSISNNNCSNNDYGIPLVYSDNNSISNNICPSNNDDGICLSRSNNNSISNNNCSNNWDGIYLLGSNNNCVSNNNCSNNRYYGILLVKSNNNCVSNNNCSNNEDDGISLWTYSDNNSIYLNNFINNADNGYSYKSTNIWNSTSKIAYTYNGSTYTNYMGNYCDDYEGTDADADGIGDTPYSIDSDKDNHPLMEPFEHYFEEAKPTISISTDKHEYTGGDTMLINLTLTNPTEEPQPVYFAWRLDLPDYDLQYWIMTKALYLPSDYEQTFPIPFTLGDYGIPFNASWYVALYDTTTLEAISEDTADWRYVPAKERVRDGDEVMPEVEEIARVISKTVEKIKSPT